MRIRIPLVAAACLALAACGGLAKDDVPVSLAEAGIATTVNVPSGGKVKKKENGASVDWVGLSWIASLELDGGRSYRKRVAVARDTPDSFRGEAPVTIGAKSYMCLAGAKTQADAERLMKVCDALAAASPPAPTAAPAASAAPLELEERSFTAKAPLNAPVQFKAKVPKGWAVNDDRGPVIVQDPNPRSMNALSINFALSLGVKSLADAEREMKSLDPGGLDQVDQKRELAPGRLLLTTVPRGTLKLTTYRVFARGKKGSVLATCSGPASRKDDLERVCASVEVE